MLLMRSYCHLAGSHGAWVTWMEETCWKSAVSLWISAQMDRWESHRLGLFWDLEKPEKEEKGSKQIWYHVVPYSFNPSLLYVNDLSYFMLYE